MAAAGARSTDSAKAEPRSELTAGQLAETSLPELLAHARGVAFSGTLLLEPPGAPPSTLRLMLGAVNYAAGPWETVNLEWQVLARVLPPEMLGLVDQHAEEYQLTPFQAVERLALLPLASLGSARENLAVLGVQALCELPEDTHYAFLSALERPSTEPGLDPPLEPLGLLVACLLVGPQQERAVKALAPFEDTKLSVEPGRARLLFGTLSGWLRAVVESLLRAPESLRKLRERRLMPEHQLVACVHTLCLTRLVTVPAEQHSLTPPFGESQAPGPFPSGSPGSTAPQRRESGFVRTDRAVKEQAMEQKVLEAWMLAEADPSRTDRTSALVQKAISVFPANPRLHFYSACLHRQANRLEDAVKAFERALELDPNDTESRHELQQLRGSLAPPSRGMKRRTPSGAR